MEISKRDFFAAHALSGLLARASDRGKGVSAHVEMATEAFLYADEMLKLSKTLLDPVEIDPQKIVKGDTSLLDKKSGKLG